MLLAAGCLTSFTDENTEPDVLDLSVSENMAVPAVPQKAKAYVRSAMDQVRRHLTKGGMSVTSTREGEVLEITVPCSELFAPSSTELKPAAATLLKPLGIIVRDPGRYKLLITVHTDDTGDDQYADSITAERANALDDFLWTLAGETDTNTIPYGLGRDEPLGPNNSIPSRAANRRVEFIVVPDKDMLRAAGVKIK